MENEHGIAVLAATGQTPRHEQAARDAAQAPALRRTLVRLLDALDALDSVPACLPAAALRALDEAQDELKTAGITR